MQHTQEWGRRTLAIVIGMQHDERILNYLGAAQKFYERPRHLQVGLWYVTTNLNT